MVSAPGQLGPYCRSFYSRRSESDGLYCRSLKATDADIYAFCIPWRPDFLWHFRYVRILCWAARQLELFQDSADRCCGRSTLNDFGSTLAHHFVDKEKTRDRNSKKRERANGSHYRACLRASEVTCGTRRRSCWRRASRASIPLTEPSWWPEHSARGRPLESPRWWFY